MKAKQNDLLAANKFLTEMQRTHPPDPAALQEAREARTAARQHYKQAVRQEQQRDQDKRGANLNRLPSDPPAFFKSVKSFKKSSTSIKSLSVGSKSYLGDQVPDGFSTVSVSLKIQT